MSGCGQAAVVCYKRGGSWDKYKNVQEGDAGTRGAWIGLKSFGSLCYTDPSIKSWTK